MDSSEFSVEERRVVVVGAGRSGIAAAEQLTRRGAIVTLTESRDDFEGADHLRASDVHLELGGHRQDTLAAADLVVVSPGVSVGQSVFDGARARGVEIVGELELASRWTRGRVLAITGTKGKSTTTTLLGRMLTAAGWPVLVGGNIGVPLSSQVDASTPETLHVVETSSFQLETTITFRPWIAVWLNVSDDHLDRHDNVESYVSAKARIFANQTAKDWALINADDPIVSAHSEGVVAQRASFALSDGIAAGFVVNGDWIVKKTVDGVEELVPLDAVELPGRHMLNNVLAATAAASIAGASPTAMTEALRGFHGLPHVMEPAGESGGVRFVNDSKATNVEAASRSIESFAGVVAIIGGRFKGGDLRRLRESLLESGRAVVAIGEAAPLVCAALSSVVQVVVANSMRDAVIRGHELAEPDGVVLLAPACASFDWFRDYAERGESFKEEVRQLMRLKES